MKFSIILRLIVQRKKVLLYFLKI